MPNVDSRLTSPGRGLRVGFDATWLIQEHRSGTGYYLQGLLAALAKLYPDDLKLIGHYYVGPGQTPAEPSIAGVRYKKSRLLSLKVVNMLRRFGIEIPFEILLKQRVDFWLSPAYLSSPSLLGTPSAVVMYDLAFIDVPATLSPRNRADLVRFVPVSMKRSAFIITISESTKQRIVSHYAPTQPVVITPIPPSLSTGKQQRLDLGRALGITKKFILFLGTLEPRKNITSLVEAYTSLAPEICQEYSLVLAGGEGWQDDTIRSTIQQRQKDGFDIIVTGYVNDEQRQALLQQATTLALVSLYEGFGMPLLEAMSQNLAVIASDLPIFHEVCGDAAVYCDAASSADIAAAIDSVLSNEVKRHQLIVAGQKNLRRFSWDEVARTVYAAIRTAVDAR